MGCNYSIPILEEYGDEIKCLTDLKELKGHGYLTKFKNANFIDFIHEVEPPIKIISQKITFRSGGYLSFVIETIIPLISLSPITLYCENALQYRDAYGFIYRDSLKISQLINGKESRNSFQAIFRIREYEMNERKRLEFRGMHFVVDFCGGFLGQKWKRIMLYN